MACWEMKQMEIVQYSYLSFIVIVKSIWLLQLVLCIPHLQLPKHSIGLKFNQISWFLVSRFVVSVSKKSNPPEVFPPWM